MKLKLLVLCLTIGLFAFGTGVNAQDASEPGAKGAGAPNIDFTPIINAIIGKIDNKDAQALLCKKADVSKGIVTLRSFAGAGCQNVPVIGAVAAVLCEGYKDADGPYESSTCAKNNPYKTADAGVEALQAHLDVGTNANKIFCGSHTFTSPNLKKIAAACPGKEPVCKTDKDCKSGETCVEGKCEAKAPGKCTPACNADIGETCVKGKCTVVCNTTCASGETCRFVKSQKKNGCCTAGGKCHY